MRYGKMNMQVSWKTKKHCFETSQMQYTVQRPQKVLGHTITISKHAFIQKIAQAHFLSKTFHKKKFVRFN